MQINDLLITLAQLVGQGDHAIAKSLVGFFQRRVLIAQRFNLARRAHRVRHKRSQRRVGDIDIFRAAMQQQCVVCFSILFLNLSEHHCKTSIIIISLLDKMPFIINAN